MLPDAQAIIDALPNPVLLVERTDRAAIRGANAALLRLLQLDIEQVRGRSVHDLLDQPAGSFADYLQDCSAAAAAPFVGTLVFRTRGGNQLELQCYGTPVADAGGATAPIMLHCRHRGATAGEVPLLGMSIAALTQQIADRPEAADAIRASEARYRLFADATLDAIIIHDFATVLDVNARAAAIFGYAPEELIGQNTAKLTELIAPEDRAGLMQRALAGDSALVEMTGVRRDGSRFPIEYAARDFTIGDRRIRVGVGRDITERKRAEAALAERDERLRLAIAAGRMTAWERIMGQSTVTLYSGTQDLAEPRQDLDKLRAGLHPDDAPRVRAAFDAAVAGNGLYQAEYRVRDAGDGTWRWMSDHGTVHYDAAGNPVRVIGVAQDITERRDAEQALRDSEERFRTILETLPHIAFLLDLDGTMTFWNQRFVEYFGEAVPDLERRRALFHPDDMAAIRAARDEGVATGDEYAFSARVRRHDGSYRWHAVHIRPLRRDGSTVAWLGMSVDIDDNRRQNEILELRVAERTAALEEANRALRKQIEDRERAEAALVRAQKMEAVGQLTGGVAHDFNNLLTAVIGSLEMIHRDAQSARVLRLTDSALRAATRGAELTHQLLSFARRQVLKPVVSDVAALLNEMEILLRHAVGGAVEVGVDHAADLWACEVDPAQFQSAVLNLVVNARDAMPRGGRLTIEARNAAAHEPQPGLELTAGDYVAVAVRDTGEGMPADVAARAFEPFFTTKDIGKGSGLGLSMVYGFAQQSGGGVTLDSAPGSGTCVTIYLPRARQPAVAADAERGIPAQDGTGAILVVDDDDNVRDVSLELLRGLGYRVSAAADGHEALACLEREQFDLLFTDIVMPRGISGFELARQAQRLRPGLKVLLTSGYPLPETANPEQFQILAKPFHSADLASLVAEIIERPDPSGPPSWDAAAAL